MFPLAPHAAGFSLFSFAWLPLLGMCQNGVGWGGCKIVFFPLPAQQKGSFASKKSETLGAGPVGAQPGDRPSPHRLHPAGQEPGALARFCQKAARLGPFFPVG